MSEKGVIIFKCFNCETLQEIEIEWTVRNTFTQVVNILIKDFSCIQCSDNFKFVNNFNML